MMKTLVIDDTKINRLALRELIEAYIPQLEVIGEAHSVKTGISLIQKAEPELLILDIELGDGTAFDILKNVDTGDFKIIFLTAYERFAVDAFKYGAVDYLLKPVNIKDLISAVNKIENRKPLTKKQLLNSERFLDSVNNISVSTQSGFETITIQNLIRCKADGRYTECHIMNEKTIISSKNLKEFERILNDHDFVRVHHSHLINIKHIKSYNRYDQTVSMVNGDIVPISQRKRKYFLKRLNIV